VPRSASLVVDVHSGHERREGAAVWAFSKFGAKLIEIGFLNTIIFHNEINNGWM
jgi:hypothetical protein